MSVKDKSKRKVSKKLKFKFGLKQRISLYERIAAFLDAPIDLVNTLKSIRDRYQKTKDFRAKIIDDWLNTINNGGKFGDAIMPWVPAAEHMLISAGEDGVGLVQGLREATVLSNAAAKNKAAIIGGVLMPIILFIMIFVMLIGFQTNMVPVFIGLLDISRWPSNGQYLYYVSKFVYDYWYVIAAIVIILAFIIGATIDKWTGPIRDKFDALPPWSLYKNYQGSSFLIGLSSLMNAGVASFEALKTMHKNASPWMKVHLDKMMNNMRLGGTTPGEALNTGLLDKETAGDVEDYSRLGTFQNAIHLLGSRSLDKSIERTNQKMGVLKNVLLVLVALSVLMVYTTTYSLQGEVADSMSQNR